MPLRVHCPGGCLLRLPTNRAGKVVRCPQCKLVIRIPDVSQTELASGKPVPVRAETVDGKQASEPEWASAFRLEPAAEDKFAEARSCDATDGTEIRIDVRGSIETAVRSRNQALDAGAGGDWTARLAQAISEKEQVNRLYAVGVMVVGIFDLVPVAWRIGNGTEAISADVPMWCWLLGLVAVLHFIYSFFLWQIRDWSALAAVALVQLLWAMILAAVATAIALSGGHGSLAVWLGLGVATSRAALIWCMARLCLAVLVSYLLGREVYLWLRTERMLQELQLESTNNIAGATRDR